MAMYEVTGGGSKKKTPKASPPKQPKTAAKKTSTASAKKPAAKGVGVSAGAGVSQSVFQKVKNAVNPVNPEKTGWMNEQVKKRTTVTPLPTSKKKR